MLKKIALFSSLFICLIPKEIETANILFISPLSTRSENQLFIPLVKELALRDHSIVFLGSGSANLKMKNFREIIPLEPLDFSDLVSSTTNPIEGRRMSKDTFSWMASYDFSFIYKDCRKVYEYPGFQKLYRESFDLIIISGCFNNCFDGLVHKFQAPLIIISSLPVSGSLAELTGLRMPLSFVPNPFLEFTDKMNFGERFTNTMMGWMFDLMYKYLIAPESEKIYREYLGQDYPSMLDIERNVSIIFSNSHLAVTSVRPLLPDIVEIGGMHCKQPQRLPKDLEDFVSGAGEDGFIYFSLGSVVKGTSLPTETRKMFIKVFSGLKQRVLWKWETEQMDDLPKNVKLGKWFPQQDILGHKNIKLFISHGGLFSIQETAYHGVPVLGIPFMIDQDVNLKQAVAKGYAESLEILDLTEEKLEKAIQTMINEPKYVKNSQKVSKIFKDQPSSSSLDLAVYWTEYVLRYKGASHLRSGSRQLNDIQYHSYDIIATLTAIILTIGFVILKIFMFVCCFCCKSNVSNVQVKSGGKNYGKRKIQ